MALTSVINADSVSKEDLMEKNECEVEIYFGIFFDGTSNNMIPSAQSRKLRADTVKKYKGENKTVDKKTSTGIPEKHRYEFEVLESHKNDDGFTSMADVVKNDKKRLNTKYSNIAILHSYYKAYTSLQSSDNENKKNSKKKKIVYKVYVEGAGANDIKSKVTGIPVVGLGFGLGKTGVVALVSKAVHSVSNILAGYSSKAKNVSLHFDVFGFSRGSACARLFAYLIARGDDETLPPQRESEFGEYVARSCFDSKRLNFVSKDPRGKKIEWKSVSIDFLGIYDTVASIGFLRRRNDEGEDVVNGLQYAFKYNQDFNNNYHDSNVKEYGLNSPSMKMVKSTCHICAMDEFRENFAITDIGSTVPDNSIELFLPGCHSDIGGGYINDDFSVLDFHNTHDLGYYTAEPQKTTGTVEHVNKATMIKLGWDDILAMNIHQHSNSIRIKRKVPQTFCNVPLHLMKERMCEKVTDRGDIFEKALDTFNVPDGLENFYQNILSQMKEANGVRKFIYPVGGYGGKDYQRLRLNYLHSTSSDIALVKLVQGANYSKCANVKPNQNTEGLAVTSQGNNKNEHTINNVVCRIVYHGDPDDTSMHYMYDYNVDSIKCGSVS